MIVPANTSPPEMVLALRSACIHYSNLVAEAGVNIKAFEENSSPFVSQKSLALLQKAIQAITADIEIFESMKNEGISLRDSKTHVWRFLHQMKWTPQSDIFDKIETDDIVEVYLLDHSGQNQLFRNLRFLECVSFSIEQLYGLNWKLATYHDARYEQDIMTAIHKILSQERPVTVAFGSDPHFLQELNSPKKFKLRTQLKYLSPLRQNNQTVAMLATNHSDVIHQME